MKTISPQTRIAVITLAVMAAIVLIILLNILPIGEDMARFLVDRNGDEINIWAAQNAMWIAFFWGMAELMMIHRCTKVQEKELELHYLPEDDSTLLLKSDMAAIQSNIHDSGRSGMLAEMVRLVASQFQSTGSVALCNGILNTNTELRQHEIDLHYSGVRYITWLLPSLGFIGTVYGILVALKVASTKSLSDPNMLSEAISGLSVAFWTTLLALLMSCVIMFFTHIVQTREERLLNNASRYCVKNLINRLLER